MRTLVLFGLIGFVTHLVCGTLGMGYGAISSTLLLTVGVTPAAASTSVHLAEVGTYLASGVAHWRFKNINWRTVGLIAVPGMVGAVAGAYVLTSLSTDVAAPWMSTILMLLGLHLMLRFGFRELRKPTGTDGAGHGAAFLAPLGLVAGFVDATGGGGWGPVTTTALLTSGRLEPRKVVGSTDAAKFAVSVAASVGLLATLGASEKLDSGIVLGMLIGGVLAAPFAAWLVKWLPARILGAAAGGLIVLTNAQILLGVLGAGTTVVVLVYVVLALVWVLGVTAAVRSWRAERASARAQLETRAPEVVQSNVG